MPRMVQSWGQLTEFLVITLDEMLTLNDKTMCWVWTVYGYVEIQSPYLKLRSNTKLCGVNFVSTAPILQPSYRLHVSKLWLFVVFFFFLILTFLFTTLHFQHPGCL